MHSRLTPFVALALAAGSIDAIAFVSFEVFPANMTGNTVLLGIAIASQKGQLAGNLGIAPPLIAIAAFVIGAAVAVPVMGNVGFSGRRAAVVIAGEAVLVGAAGFANAFVARELVMPVTIALTSLSMGAQSVAAMKANISGVSTTYVTGTLVSAVMKAFSQEPNDRKDAARDMWVWIGYLAGAVCGGALLIALHHYALFPVAVLLLGLAAWLAYQNSRE